MNILFKRCRRNILLLITIIREFSHLTSVLIWDCWNLKGATLRLVFTSDGVVVSVVIASVERYDPMKIKPTESEADNWFCLWLCCLWSSENCIVGVASRSGRISQWQCLIPGLAIGWFFRLCFRLWQPSFHWIISDRVVNGIRRNGNVLILLTPIPLSLWLSLRLRFLIFTRS